MRLTRPTRAAGRERPHDYHDIVTSQPLLFGLAPGGVYRAAPVTRGAVRSYRTVSPLPEGPANRSCAGGLFSVALSLGSPPPAVSRHRVPVEPGLSSTNGIAPPAAVVRLSGDAGFALVPRVGSRGLELEGVIRDHWDGDMDRDRRRLSDPAARSGLAFGLAARW